jgi:hypothetical protein
MSQVLQFTMKNNGPMTQSIATKLQNYMFKSNLQRVQYGGSRKNVSVAFRENPQALLGKLNKLFDLLSKDTEISSKLDVEFLKQKQAQRGGDLVEGEEDGFDEVEQEALEGQTGQTGQTGEVASEEGEENKESKGWFSSILSLVGLGGSSGSSAPATETMTASSSEPTISTESAPEVEATPEAAPDTMENSENVGENSEEEAEEEVEITGGSKRVSKRRVKSKVNSKRRRRSSQRRKTKRTYYKKH